MVLCKDKETTAKNQKGIRRNFPFYFERKRDLNCIPVFRTLKRAMKQKGLRVVEQN